MKKKLLLVLTLSLGFLGCLNAFEEGYKSVLNTLHDLEEQDKKENNDKKKKISTYCNLCKMECYDVSFFLEHKEIIHAGYQDNQKFVCKQFVCKACDSTFNNKEFLVSHHRFYCKILQEGDKEEKKVLKHRADFLEHKEIIHAGYQDNQKFVCKQFVCKACDSTFNNKEFLVSHHRFYCKILQEGDKEEKKVLKHRADNNDDKNKTVKKIKPTTYSVLEKDIAAALLDMRNSK